MISGPSWRARCRPARGRREAHEVLRLDVDAVASGAEGVEGERRDLADLRVVSQLRRGAGDRDRSTREIGLRDRMAIAPLGLDRFQLLAGGIAPADPRELRKRLRCRSVHHHLQIVDRGIGGAFGRQPQRVVRAVPLRVPPLDREVDAAGKGQAVVDADDLLVMGRIDRVLAIEAQVDAG